MVEEIIKKYNGEYTRTEIWNKLDIKMMYQTFKIIMDYLINSKKVIIKDEKVVWIFNPGLMDKLMENSVEN
jgi:outer membrane lipoprotein-sorting protein